MSLGELIRKRRDELHLTQDRVAEQAGISKPYLSNIETGKAKPPTDGILEALERTLRFQTGELLNMAHLDRTPPDIRQEHEHLLAEVQRLRAALRDVVKGSPRESDPAVAELLGRAAQTAERPPRVSAGVTVPVLNKVPAGYPRMRDLDRAHGNATEYIRCPDIHDPQAFAIRVVGDSMEDRYGEGDIVIFSPNAPARSGDDCLVCFEADGETNFVRFYLDGDAIRLQPLNPKYAPTTHARADIAGLWPAVFCIHKIGTRA